MNIEGLTLDPATKTPIVVLRDGEGKFSLPIWIGLLEATQFVILDGSIQGHGEPLPGQCPGRAQPDAAA